MTEEEKTENGNKGFHEEEYQISERWRIFLVGMAWMFWLSAIYSFLFVSWTGMIFLAFIGQVFYGYAKKYKAAVVPRRFTAWLHSTRFYDIFIRKVFATTRRKILGPYLVFAIAFLYFGINFLLLVWTMPALDLNQMVVVHGTYAGYQKLRASDGCGDMMLNFRTEDGKLFHFWAYQSFWSPSKLQQLEQQTKGEVLTIWGAPNTIDLQPKCRKFPSEMQIQGKEYQDIYHKEYAERNNRNDLIIAVICLFGGGLCLLRIYCDDGAE